MFAFALAATIAAAPVANPCAYDRTHLMALDQNAFDQDLTGGWRKLAENPTCELVAADLIRDYRQVHHLKSSILFWHEGQLRADAGQTSAAIALFEQSREKEPDRFGWNAYLDGTVAFLEHDHAALQAARDRLAALPRPAHFNPTGPDGKPFKINWPPNLDVLDGFLVCFHRPYAEAYGSDKCVTQKRIEVPGGSKAL